jgi:hypothetical protein
MKIVLKGDDVTQLEELQKQAKEAVCKLIKLFESTLF